jgi:capsular exopolysaccharide synthesis family protein
MMSIFKRRISEVSGTPEPKQQPEAKAGVSPSLQVHPGNGALKPANEQRFQQPSPLNGQAAANGKGSVHSSGAQTLPGLLHESLKTWPKGFENVECVRYEARPEHRLVGVGQNHDLGTENFHLLCHRLQRLRQQRPVRSLLIASSIPREGKTVVATNLAVALARNSDRVALVDADMRQARSNRPLGLGALPGLAEFLEGKLELGAGIRYIDPLGLYFLPAGNTEGNPYELLQRPRVHELMQAMASFDWVIFDSPPFTPFADAHCLAALTDAVLVVVRPGMVRQDVLQRSLANLDAAHVAGVVVNATDDPSNENYYYSYYGPGAPAKQKSKPLP